MSVWAFRRSLSEIRCGSCRGPVVARPAIFVVEAERWFDARAEAASVLHTDELRWEETTAEPEVRLRWEGHDAGAVPNRRMVREVPDPIAHPSEQATRRGHANGTPRHLNGSRK